MCARILACLLLVLPLGGCSLAFTSGPPPKSERGELFLCTTSYLAPVLDVAWVSYALAATAAERSGGIGAGDFTLSAVWIGSAVHGIRNVRRCRAAIEEAGPETPPVCPPDACGGRIPKP